MAAFADPYLVLLHGVATGLSSSELTELKFLCSGRVSKRKLERVQSALDLFNVLLEQGDLGPDCPELLRELLAAVRRHDLLRRLDDFEAGAGARATAAEEDLHAAFDFICDNVGKDWKKLARQLQISDTRIEVIVERYPRNLTEQVRESLRTWKATRRQDATVPQLVAALRACKLNLVADLLEEEQQARSLQNTSGPASNMSGPASPMSSVSWSSDGSASGAP